MSIRDHKFFPVLYMFVITAVCSAILIGFSKFTRERVEANEVVAIEQAALSVFQLDEGLSGLQIHDKFSEVFKAMPDNLKDVSKSSDKSKSTKQSKGTDNKTAQTYILTQDGKTSGYAVHFEGEGFWADIKGFIGIASDGVSVTGIAFYEQAETSGLGAEIVKPKFRNQFLPENKKQISLEDEPFRIRRPGTDLKNNEVYAVTGATQTSVRLEKMLNDRLIEWREDMKKAGVIK